MIDKKLPHHGPRARDIDMIIIHSMGEYIRSDGLVYEAHEWLNKLGLSAHYLIHPDGTVVRCVPDHRRAYHAGKSKWKGVSDLNHNSIGIEFLVEGIHDYASFLEAIKDPDTFTEDQYSSGKTLCGRLQDKHGIETKMILPHSAVSGSDVRPDSPKYDVGDGFNMARLRR